MSNQTNDRILDEIRELGDIVQFHREYWTGTLWDYTLEEAYIEAIKTLDASRINQLLMDSSKEMFDKEYSPAVEGWKKQHSKTGFNLDEVPF